MRILFLSSSGHLGGAERLLLDLVGALRQAHPEWALHLISVEPGPFVNDASALGVRTAVVPLPRGLAGLGEAGVSAAGVSAAGLLRRAALATWPLRQYVRTLREHVAAIGPSLVHSNGLKTHLLSAWAAGRRVPLVWHLHDYVGARPMTSRLLALAAGRADFGIAPSASVAADAARALRQKLPMATVLNGVDVAALSSAGPGLDLDRLAGLPPAPPGTIRIGLLATFARWKGQLAFLDALSRLPADTPVRGYVIGGPIYQTGGSQFGIEELAGRATALGLGSRVGFTGFQPDRAAALHALDVVVHASTQPEPFGLVIAEAMAAGRAVITSGLGGAAELIESGVDALTWDPADVTTLAAQIDRLARDTTLRERLGLAAAGSAARKFSRERLAAGVTETYALALARHAARR